MWNLPCHGVRQEGVSLRGRLLCAGGRGRVFETKAFLSSCFRDDHAGDMVGRFYRRAISVVPFFGAFCSTGLQSRCIFGGIFLGMPNAIFAEPRITCCVLLCVSCGQVLCALGLRRRHLKMEALRWPQLLAVPPGSFFQLAAFLASEEVIGQPVSHMSTYFPFVACSSRHEAVVRKPTPSYSCVVSNPEGHGCRDQWLTSSERKRRAYHRSA